MNFEKFAVEIKEKNESLIHSIGALQGDLTLCGMEMDGDSFLGICPAIPTTKKINCPHCIAIIKLCKLIPLSAINEKHRP